MKIAWEYSFPGVLVRTPAGHPAGRGFESRRSGQQPLFQKMPRWVFPQLLSITHRLKRRVISARMTRLEFISSIRHEIHVNRLGWGIMRTISEPIWSARVAA